jgi:hypothetical protein
MYHQTTGPDEAPAVEVPEADAQEQRQGLADEDLDPEAVAGRAPDLDVVREANEADLAEQQYDVPDDEDDLDR